MKKKLLLLLVGSLCLGLRVQAAELVVQAAASLTDAMKEIGAAYEKETGVKITCNFGASSMLARQIEEQAPADLFLSADEAKMDGLEKKDLLLPGTRRTLLTNQLVIVIPADSKLSLSTARDLAKPEYKKIALAESSSVPAGIYAKEYLIKLGVWEAIQPKVIPTENVRAALAAVESGNAEAGIVYKTDAMITRKVTVALEVAAADGPKITYPLAVLKSSKDPEEATKFANYLAGAAARETFAKFGFAFAK